MNAPLDMEKLGFIEKLGFAQRQRLTYIEAVAYWEGAVDRPRISSVFGVTENHVTKDFRLYKKTFPDNIRYDETTRVYRPTMRFTPQIGTGTAEEYLSILRTYAEHENAAMMPGLGMVLPVYATPQPKGTVEKDVLNSITRAISSRSGLEIEYQSMTRAQPVVRKIWPHALLFSGTRWHARAYDNEKEIFIDLVLQRMLSAKAIGESESIKVPEDEKWSTFVEIEIVPKPTLTPMQATVVAREFGMVKNGSKWIWTVKIRECLAGYFLVLHRLDVKDDPWRHIALRNPEEVLARYLPPPRAA